MKIVRFYKPIFASILTLIVLITLPGFKTELPQDNFVAPIENPGILLYHNFSTSGIYEDIEASEAALKEISQEMEMFAVSNGNRLIEKTAAGNFVREQVIDGSFKPQELFFYYADQQNFAIILQGSFMVEKIAKNFPAGSFRLEDDDFYTTYPGFGKSANSRIGVHIKSDFILISPIGISSEMLLRVTEGKCYLDQKFTSFRKMVRGKPAIAGEIDIEMLGQSIASTSIRTPQEFQFLRHVRLIADNKLTKIQFSVPDEESRTVFGKNIGANLHFLDSFVGGTASFTSNLKGRSIYVETDARIELEQKISRKFAALIFHFLEKTDSRNEFKTAGNTLNEN